jgi:hypothetical protein
MTANEIALSAADADQPWFEREIQSAIDAAVAEASKRGVALLEKAVAAERAAVVKWLRSDSKCPDAVQFESLALAIAQAVHLETKP